MALHRDHSMTTYSSSTSSILRFFSDRIPSSIAASMVSDRETAVCYAKDALRRGEQASTYQWPSYNPQWTSPRVCGAREESAL